MTQYLVAIHHPNNYDPSTEDQAMARAIDVLNEEMAAAGVRVFVGGLTPVSDARSLRAQPGGKVLVTDGPYLETKNTLAVSGWWKPRISTRHLPGAVRLSLPVAHRSKCVPSECPSKQRIGNDAARCCCLSCSPGFADRVPALTLKAVRRNRMGDVP